MEESNPKIAKPILKHWETRYHKTLQLTPYLQGKFEGNVPLEQKTKP